MLPRSAASIAARRAMAPLASLLVSLATGCVTRLDMATAYDPSRPATTLPYASVRGARQFTDYGAIGKSILTGVDPSAPPSASPKAAKPKAGSK